MKNYLIIGGGIAGVTTAHQLLNLNLSFDLVDNKPQYNSSKVAAGFWNPIVFKRLTMSYKADILMPHLKEFYPKVEQKLDCQFVHYVSQLKIFSTKEERHRFIDKAIVSEVSQFLDEEVIDEINGIEAPIGMGKVVGTGYIETEKFVDESINYFESCSSFIESKVDYSDIIFKENHIEYNGKKYKKVIFCEGYHAVNNPLFPDLRLKPTKGELLIIEVPELTQDYAYAKSAGLIPIGNKQFIVGSTYDWEDMSKSATESAKKKLLYNLADFLKANFKVIDQQAGIRPSSYDRRPIIGKSNVQENAYIINGFGTKRVMYAPYYSAMLINNIVYSSDMYNLEKEIELVVPFAKIMDSWIQILHIDKDNERFEGDLQQKEERLRRDFSYQKINLREQKSDSVIQGINKFVADVDADMVIMFTHHTNFLEKVFQKSVAQNTAFQTRIPLFTFQKDTIFIFIISSIWVF
mgnify:CR=1 FL=1